MTNVILPGVLVWATVGAAMVVAYMAVVRHGLHPATVDPFHGAPPSAPGADTLSDCSALTRTPPPMPAASGWTVRTLDNLSAVEDLLDTLENNRVVEREVFAVGNACFAVRWR